MGIKWISRNSALIATGVCLMLAGGATAQTFTVVHSLTGSEGLLPWSALTLSGNTLFGTASSGGSFGVGDVFKVHTEGSGFTVLYSFTNTGEGVNPYGGLVLSGNMLYGTTRYGGYGTVFAVSTNGMGFTNLHIFNGVSDGSGLNGNLVLWGGVLYGTTVGGGPNGAGTVFKINVDGSGFTNLHSFAAVSSRTNSDGTFIDGGLVLSGGSLYGTAYNGGSEGSGTVFKLNTDGTGFSVLHTFTAAAASESYVNSDGAYPYAGLIASGNTLYGTTSYGGSSGAGTVFKVNSDGSDFTSLYSFSGGDDGERPYGTLLISGGTLYGTTLYGGNSATGTVFSVSTDGTGFKVLHHFTGGNDGAVPAAGLVSSGNTFYGTASRGGEGGKGTVFSISLSLPQLTIFRAGTSAVLTWTGVSFGLQSASSVSDPFTNVLGATSPYTNPISGGQQFFRLISN